MLVEKLLPRTRKRMQCIELGAALLQAARLLDDGRDMLLVRDEEGRLAGILTKTDVVRQIGRCAGASCTAPVAQAMTRDVVSVRPDGWLQEAWEAMKERGFKNLPITDDAGRPLGVLNAREALQALLDETRHEEELLRDYVMNVGFH
jgi:arabinose-5-phosphate isomerase